MDDVAARRQVAYTPPTKSSALTCYTFRMSTEWHPYFTELYGAEQAPGLAERLEALIAAHGGRRAATTSRALDLSERDALLITYGDQVTAPGEAPLRTLADVCRRHLRGLVGGVHILPFYPWTSDDGFSVVDYPASRSSTTAPSTLPWATGQT